MPPEPLDRLQQRMWRLITAPTGVSDALWTVSDDDLPTLPLCGWIRAEDERGAAARLDVYANMYFYRLLGALREVYPRLASLLGEVTFHNLVTDYLLAHPSSHPSIGEAGRALPAFLQHHGLSEGRPYLPDLAALEWVRGEVFDLPDSKPLGAEVLGALAAPEWEGLRLRPIHAVRTLQVNFSIEEIWRALPQGRALGEPRSSPSSLLIWRRGFQVYHRQLTPDEVVVLPALLLHAPFAALCEELADRLHGGDPDAGAQAMARVLAGWLGDELLLNYAA